MRKHLKSIAAAILAVVMLMSISTSAMAAEQVTAADETVIFSQNNGSSLYDATPDIYGSQQVWLQNNRVLNYSLNFSESSRTVQYKLVGKSIGTSGKKVTFKFTNNAHTNMSRTFTVTANGTWSSTTYTTSYPAGNYTLSVESAEAAGVYAVNIIFLP